MHHNEKQPICSRAHTAAELVVARPIARVPVSAGWPQASAYTPSALTVPSQTHAPTDPFAIASAIAGITAFIPILSQLAGLVCGAAAIWRIRKARAAGIAARGYGWAAIGLVMSTGALLCWIFTAVMLGWVATQLSTVSGGLDHALAAPAAR